MARRKSRRKIIGKVSTKALLRAGKRGSGVVLGKCLQKWPAFIFIHKDVPSRQLEPRGKRKAAGVSTGAFCEKSRAKMCRGERIGKSEMSFCRARDEKICLRNRQLFRKASANPFIRRGAPLRHGCRPGSKRESRDRCGWGFGENQKRIRRHGERIGRLRICQLKTAVARCRRRWAGF